MANNLVIIFGYGSVYSGVNVPAIVYFIIDVENVVLILHQYSWSLKCWLNFWYLTDPVKPALFYAHLCYSSFSHSSLVEISSEHLHSQTVRGREVKFWDKVHLPHLSCVICHMSSVMCPVSHVTCHMSRVTCNYYNFFPPWLNGETSRWRVCYKWGYPV